MKLKMSLAKPILAISKRLKLSKVRSPIVYTLVFILGVSSNVTLAGRFDPPSLKLPLQQFDSRIDAGIFNVEFLLAHILNNSRKTVREVGEITDTVEDLLQNTTVFTNDNTGNNGASAGSVIIPPGTTADTIIILNQNEGDSIAIQR